MNCCPENALISKWKEYYRKYDILQVPLLSSYWNKNIPKINCEEIPKLEKKYIIIRQEFQGVKYLLLKDRSLY